MYELMSDGELYLMNLPNSQDEEGELWCRSVKLIKYLEEKFGAETHRRLSFRDAARSRIGREMHRERSLK